MEGRGEGEKRERQREREREKETDRQGKRQRVERRYTSLIINKKFRVRRLQEENNL